MVALLDRSSIPLIAFCVLSVVVAAVCHWWIRRLLVGSTVAALIAAIAFLIIGYFAVGYLDPFFAIALTTSFAAAFIIAVLVGLAMRYSSRDAT